MFVLTAWLSNQHLPVAGPQVSSEVGRAPVLAVNDPPAQTTYGVAGIQGFPIIVRDQAEVLPHGGLAVGFGDEIHERFFCAAATCC